jgi:RNA polymerase sigma-70 factor (sigma-E family)
MGVETGRLRATVRGVERASPDVERLYREQALRCGRLAYLLTGDDQRAQELVQEAFAHLMRRWRAIENPNSLEAYLRRSVVNLARKDWRKRAHEVDYLRRRAWEPLVTDSQPDIETRDQLRRALAQLTFRQRAAVVLKYYEDLSERDIAALLGCATGTVKSSLSRALTALRVRLEDDNGE